MSQTTPWSQLPVALQAQAIDLVALSHANGDGTYTSVRVTLGVLLTGIPTVNAVRLGQFKRALTAISATLPIEIATSISADPGDTYNIAWTSDPFVFPAGPLYNYVQAYLGYSTGQMVALLADASVEPG